MKQWYDLGTETLRTAREGRGLSYEAMGRLLHVSGKTYERWEKRGQVPKAPAGMIDQVAETLGLEIQYERQPQRVVTVPEYDDSELALVERRLEDLLDVVQALRRERDEPRQGQSEDTPRERPARR